MKFTVVTSPDAEPDQSREFLELFDAQGNPLDLPGFPVLINEASEAAAAAVAAAEAATDAANGASSAASGALEAHRSDKTDVHGVADMDKVLRISGSNIGQFNLPAPGAMSGTPLVGYTPKTQQSGVGRPIMLSCSVAVISEPQQNGHISLQIAGPQAAPNEAVAPPDNWFLNVGTIACRNNNSGAEDAGDEIAAGGPLAFPVPHGWWWRLKFEQINGWGNPTFVYLGPASLVVL